MQPGTVLAHYRIESLIGRGGMGEVYRAHDTKLGRDVALKILPAEFAGDGDRLVRFEREAKVLASLHHPNIASIFGFERTAECTFLAMELVEGEDLAATIAGGALPVDEAVDIARQIAEGLEEAHEKGIIHRDLKPANIRLTTDGRVKVLDFGLARAFSGETASEGEISAGPTMTAAVTQAGTILGTAAYMSPEQARGKDVDRRTDIWAFGVILFEMLTGKQLFRGETASDTLAGILKSDPDWDGLPDGIPFQVERVLRRCLAKDPRQRLRDIGEARIRLEDPTAESGMFTDQMSAVVEPGDGLRRRLPWALAVVATLAAVFLGLSGDTGGRDTGRTPYRFELRHPTGSVPTISPDGSRFAFIDDHEGISAVWVQTFAETEPRVIRGTEALGDYLVWSPDGNSVAYFTEETLERVDVDGGSPRTVCRLPRGWRVGDWSARGDMLVEVLLNPEENGWYRCSLDNGSVEKIDRPLELESGQSRAWPEFLPDGDHYVFTHVIDGVRQAVLTRLSGADTEVMFPTDTRVEVSDDGWYLFSRRGQLLAQAFDPGSYRPVGEPRIVADEVDLFAPNGRLQLSASDEGTLLYRTFESDRRLAWYDREGRDVGTALEVEDCRGESLSPDGERLVLILNDTRAGTGELWLRDLRRELTTRLTDTPWAEFSAVWSPDGRQLVYSADDTGPPHLFVLPVDGGPARELTPMDQTVQYPSDWLPDGTILFQRLSAENMYDLYSVPSAGGGMQPIAATEYTEVDGVVSPDGRWLAYATRSSTDRMQVYVKPFDGGAAAQRVSVDGGWTPRWDAGGSLFYRGPQETLLMVELEAGETGLRIGRPKTVLSLPEMDIVDYDLHPDGRILLSLDAAPRDHQVSHVMVNWSR